MARTPFPYSKTTQEERHLYLHYTANPLIYLPSVPASPARVQCASLPGEDAAKAALKTIPREGRGSWEIFCSFPYLKKKLPKKGPRCESLGRGCYG